MATPRLTPTRLYELCWHPVCTLAELDAASPHPLAVRLLGRDLAVARTGAGFAAVADRCPHRSTRLSVGWIEGGGIRCAYHGWCFGPDGRGTEIPAVPDGPISPRAMVDAYEVEADHGLLWVRLDPAAGTTIPPCPGFADPSLRAVAGEPYTWPTSAARRVENFVDLAHFAWVHAGTLGRRDHPVPPVPEVQRVGGELRFAYDPPELDAAAEALCGAQRYRMPMPLTVDIEFRLPSGARRELWMTAAPVDEGTCRTFWYVCRDDDTGGADVAAVDDAHLAFQQIVLDEDQPVVCNQVPPELPLDAGIEVSVRTDRVSIEYRRWLRELAGAAGRAPATLGDLLRSGPRLPASLAGEA